MCTSLKVTPHPRGHIASCNGRVESIEAWAEPVDIPSCSNCASHRAAQVQRLAQQEGEKKLAELTKFRKNVKRRVRQVEKTREQKTCVEMTLDSPRKVTFDHTPSHAATPTQNPEDEVVQVEKALIEGGSSLAQQARRALLGMCTEQAAWRTTDNGTAERSMHAENQADERTSERNTLTYHHFTEEPRLAGTCSSLPQGRHSSQDEPRDRQPVAALKPSGESIPLISAQSQSNLAAEPKGCPSPPRAPMGQGSDRGCGRCIIVAPGKLEHTQRVQAQKQQLVLRRLWSQLEREQVRRAECKKREHLCATRLKNQREAERKMQENESFTADSDLAELELTEDREKAEQWAALMALEERKHKLTKAKENERFIEALREKVKQRMIQKHSQLPALCSCARTFWETDPDTCANNCIFYKNEKAYAKALWNLMVSLELQ